MLFQKVEKYDIFVFFNFVHSLWNSVQQHIKIIPQSYSKAPKAFGAEGHKAFWDNFGYFYCCELMTSGSDLFACHINPRFFLHFHIASVIEEQKKRAAVRKLEDVAFEQVTEHPVEEQISQLEKIAHQTIVNTGTKEMLFQSIDDFIGKDKTCR